MEEEIKKELKKHWYSNLPKWLKILLLIISLITLVYWLGLMLYKILNAIRVIGAFIFEKRNYWTFLTCILILITGALILAQFYFNLDPVGKIANWFNNNFSNLREIVGDTIKGRS